MPPERLGLLSAVAAYLIWGLMPLFWPLLEPAAPPELLAHRFVWALVFLAGILALTRGFSWVRSLGSRRAALLALAAVLVTINWGVFIHAVLSEQVVEASLGYFINPLVTVALGVLVLGERLSRPHAVAVAIAGLGVVVMTIEHGRLPWIALSLALAFGLYGLVKKRVAIDGLQSVAFESALLAPVALGFIVWLAVRGEGTAASEGAGHFALLVAGGVLTAIPLVLFGAAAVRIPLVTLGLIQYLAPAMQFVIGVANGEPMSLGRLAGFVLVWVALAIFSVTLVQGARAARRAAPGLAGG